MVKDTFTKLGIEKDIVKALAEENIITPSDIQIKSIPIILSGKDIIGKSKTGSGKTGAFAIPIINMTKHSNSVKSLILAPTRELAIQISNEFSKFSKYKHLNFATVYGGASIKNQIKEIKKADIVIGTPGRIIDHLVNHNLDLSKLNNFVLDEADQMVDMGFIIDIEKILNFTSDHKQIILFGATISEEVNYLISNYMNKPVIAESETNVSNDFLKQYYYPVKRQNKFSLLTHLLKTKESEQVIVFCSSIVTVKMVHQNLKSNGIEVGMIHGKMNQNKRIKSKIADAHPSDNEKFESEGYYGEFSDDNYPYFCMPVDKESFIQQFQQDFKLSRINEPGLSIIIPYPNNEIKPGTFTFTAVTGSDTIVIKDDGHGNLWVPSASISSSTEHLSSSDNYVGNIF